MPRWTPEMMVAARLRDMNVDVAVEDGRLVATVKPGSVSGWRERLRETLRQEVSDESAREMLNLVTWRTR